jgi:hypothetical protein
VLSGEKPLVTIGDVQAATTHTISVHFGMGKGDHATMLVMDHARFGDATVQHLYGEPAKIDLRFAKGSFAAAGRYTLIVLDGDFPRVTLSLQGEDLLRVNDIDVDWSGYPDAANSVTFKPEVPVAVITERAP